MDNAYKIVPKKTDTGKWEVIGWDKMSDDEVVRAVIARRDYSKHHPKREAKEAIWNECYKYYYGNYDDRDDTLKNMTLFTIIENITAKMFRMMFHDKPIMRVFPDDPQTTVEQADNFETLLHHQIDSNKPKYWLSLWLKQHLIYGTNVMKVGYKQSIDKKVKRTLYEGKSYISMEEIKNGMPYFTVPDLFDVYPDMDAGSPYDMSYVVEIQRKRMSQLLNNDDLYINLDKLVESVREDRISKKGQQTIDSSLSKAAPSYNSSDKPYAENDTQHDEYDPIIELTVYYENNRIAIVANDKVLLRNEENKFWHKRIPFIFSQNYSDFQTPYGIGEVEPSRVLTEAEDILTQMMFDYEKVGLRHKILVPETLGIDEEALANTDNSVVYCEDPSQAVPLDIPNINIGNASSVIEGYKFRQEELTSMTPYQKGAPVREETAAGVYSIQEAGNVKFLYKVDQLELALVDLAEWFKELNYQYMPDVMELEKKNNIGEFDYVNITPEDLWGKFRFSFVGSANAENKDMQFNKLLTMFKMLVGRPDINQDYLIETLVKKSNVFDNPEKLINEPGVQGVDRIQAQMEAAGMQGGSGGIPQGGTPEEMARLQRSEVNNPNNELNGGIK